MVALRRRAPLALLALVLLAPACSVDGGDGDGDLATEWSTRGDGDDGYLVVDLGEAVPIAAVDFVTRSMGDGSAVTETFTVSVDGGAPYGPFPAGTPRARRLADLVARGRVLRFEVVTSTGGNVGAVEIGVYPPSG